MVTVGCCPAVCVPEMVTVPDGPADAGAMVMLRFAVAVTTGVAESFTCTVKDDVVAVVKGVPAIAPVVELSVRPAGKVPVVTDHV